MKKYLLLFFMFIIALPSALAQEKDRAKMMEELQKFKIDFLAKEMELSEKQRAEFTPLYKEYEKECRQSGAEVWKLERELKKNKNASEADYKKLAELQQKSRETHNEITKKFDAKLETFLSAKQIYNMHQGEEKFFEKMKEMRKKHHGGNHSNDNKGPRPSDKRPSKDKRNAPGPDNDCLPSTIDL
ncbi:MAG: hypothetical protein K2K32_03520 [Muribaculaceae bacterium]|nr:hypothetical protein [Muribaculaceae bacterium]